MFRKFLIVAMFAAAAGYCFAAETQLPQIVTSEVYYDTTPIVTETQTVDVNVQNEIPVWPIAGSDADVAIACDDGACSGGENDDNIRIV